MGFKTCFRRPFLCLSVSQKKNIDLILYIVFYWYNMR
nr:MAG TPA: hypothetical protein [Caudoviricetes sp.]